MVSASRLPGLACDPAKPSAAPERSPHGGVPRDRADRGCWRSGKPAAPYPSTGVHLMPSDRRAARIQAAAAARGVLDRLAAQPAALDCPYCEAAPAMADCPTCRGTGLHPYPLPVDAIAAATQPGAQWRGNGRHGFPRGRYVLSGIFSLYALCGITGLRSLPSYHIRKTRRRFRAAGLLSGDNPGYQDCPYQDNRRP